MTRYYLPLVDKIKTKLVSSEWGIPLTQTPKTKSNTSFIGNFQFVWDSVSLSALKTCARYYNWSIRLGWRLSPAPDTLSFGIHFHTCMEVWHKLLAQGTNKETALFRCTRLAGLLGETLIGNRTERTKETLIRAVVWYLDQFRDDQAKTTLRPNGEPAVEYSFMVPLEKINNQQTYLAGHMDRVVTFFDKVYVCDYKTTKSQLNERFFSQFKLNTQIEGYLAAGHIIGGSNSAIPEKPVGLIIDGIQLGVNFNRYQRSIIKYSQLEINSYLEDLGYWLRWANMLAEAEHWPANETACNHYGGCVFRPICLETPAKYERMLRANFTQQTWDPREAR